MTPRELFGTLSIVRPRMNRDRADSLVLASYAASGDGKAIKKLVKDILKDD